MKKILFSIFVFLSVVSNATIYYFSTTDGDDSRPTAMAVSPATPWRTITKFNSFAFLSGDSISFKCGDTFYGTMIPKSGVHIGSYATGARPVITGLSDVTGWVSIGGSIWESAVVSGGQSTAMIVTIGGISYPMGKWPNGTSTAGWRTFSGYSSTTLTDAQGTPPSNFLGGTLVIRKRQFVIQKGTITSLSGNTFAYTQFTGQNDGAINGFGYFVQNHIATLDAQNEWYWNGGAHKLDLYSTSTPANVKVSTLTNVVDLTGKSGVYITGLEFQGAIGDLITANTSTGININNCTLDHAGDCGVWANAISNFSLQNSNILNSNNFGVCFTSESNTGNLIAYNTFLYSGMQPGMAQQDNKSFVASMCGVYIGGSSTVQNNFITNSGYSGIFFGHGSALIKNNLINGFMLIKDEGGGLYCFSGTGIRTLDGNIVLNGPGAPAGKASSLTVGAGEGIYIDGAASNVSIINNSVAHVGDHGIHLTDAHEITIRNTNIYDCIVGSFFMGHTNTLIRNVRFASNIAVMKDYNLLAGGNCGYQTNESESFITAFGTSDSNVIATPINDANAWFTASAGPTFHHYTVAQAITAGMEGSHSVASPMAIGTTADLRFEYNASSSPLVVNLSGNTYIDMHSNPYSGTLTLQPWTSITLIKTGTGGNIPPSSNAGADQTVIQPTSSTTLTGTASDPDGSVASNVWTFISGPITPVIVSPPSSSTSVTGMTLSGNYTFRFTVTDNLGAVTTDDVIIHVVPTGNIPPICNAGANQTITQPASSTTVFSSASDADGSIASAAWSFISGPVTPTISTPTTLSTSVTGLSATGIYTLRLVVTDNGGATATDDILITVNPATSTQPVQFKFFKYTRIASGDSLLWATSTELNSKTFNAEWSKDSSTWITAGMINGAGTSVTEKSYKYFIPFPIQTICVKKWGWWCVEKKNTYLITHYYYRIKGIDINGKYVYSIVIKT